MPQRVLAELAAEECLALLGGVSMGRVVFTDRALPAIRPINHILDNGDVIIRTHLGSALASTVGSASVGSAGGPVVAYEADSIDPTERLGWSVVVIGMARVVVDERDTTRYERLLRPWVSMSMDRVIRIEPQIITGYRLIDPDRSGQPAVRT